jgi:hypothetical protein
MSFSRIQEARYELHQQELAAIAHDNFQRTLDHGRGLDNVPTCPHCKRATILIEVEFAPRVRLGSFRTEEPEREASYLACEWCGTEITREQLELELGERAERVPRKPAKGWEPEDEWVRRRA